MAEKILTIKSTGRNNLSVADLIDVPEELRHLYTTDKRESIDIRSAVFVDGEYRWGSPQIVTRNIANNNIRITLVRVNTDNGNFYFSIPCTVKEEFTIKLFETMFAEKARVFNVDCCLIRSTNTAVLKTLRREKTALTSTLYPFFNDFPTSIKVLLKDYPEIFRIPLAFKENFICTLPPEQVVAVYDIKQLESQSYTLRSYYYEYMTQNKKKDYVYARCPLKGFSGLEIDSLGYVYLQGENVPLAVRYRAPKVGTAIPTQDIYFQSNGLVIHPYFYMFDSFKFINDGIFIYGQDYVNMPLPSDIDLYFFNLHKRETYMMLAEVGVWDFVTYYRDTVGNVMIDKRPPEYQVFSNEYGSAVYFRRGTVFDFDNLTTKEPAIVAELIAKAKEEAKFEVSKPEPEKEDKAIKAKTLTKIVEPTIEKEELKMPDVINMYAPIEQVLDFFVLKKTKKITKDTYAVTLTRTCGDSSVELSVTVKAKNLKDVKEKVLGVLNSIEEKFKAVELKEGTMDSEFTFEDEVSL